LHVRVANLQGQVAATRTAFRRRVATWRSASPLGLNFSWNVGNNRGVPLASQAAYASISQQPRTSGVQVDYHYK